MTTLMSAYKLALRKKSVNAVLDSLSDEECREIAKLYLEDLKKSIKRELALNVERNSEKSTAEGEPPSERHPADCKCRGCRRDRLVKREHARHSNACNCHNCWVREEAARKRSEEHEARQTKIWAGIHQAMNDLKNEIRLEVTQELLESEFALGDGRVVTWGTATIEDHKTRITLLQKNAVANIEAATRHEKAIQMLKEQHASTLGEL